MTTQNMNTKTGAVLGLAALMLVLYLGIQIVFLDFYKGYGIPFGRVDVDNYLIDVVNGIDFPYHVFVVGSAIISSKMMDPSLFLTFAIPIFVSFVLLMSVFVLGVFISKRWDVAFYSTMAYVFGTISIQAFVVSALWSQMVATVFLIWAYIFFESYLEKHVLRIGIVSLAMAVLMMTAHIKSAVAFAIYGAIRYLLGGKHKFVVVLVISGIVAWFSFAANIFESYPYSVDLWFVFVNFMHPLLWLLAVISMVRLVTKDSRMAATILFCCFVFGISYFSVLWRPLLSILPFLTVFAAMELFKHIRKMRPQVGIAIGVIFMISLMFFGFGLTRSSLYAMYEEMVPGKFNETRQMDPTYFMNMFSIRDTNDGPTAVGANI